MKKNEAWCVCVCHSYKICLSVCQDHIGSLLDSVTAYTQRESEEEMKQLLSDLTYQCQQDHRLLEQVKHVVYDFPSVVSLSLPFSLSPLSLTPFLSPSLSLSL